MDSPKELALKEKELGNKAFRSRDFQTARQHYDNAICLDPENIIPYNNKAATFMEEGKYEECIRECEMAVEIGEKHGAAPPMISKAYKRAGNASLRIDRKMEARNYYDKCLALHDDAEVVSAKKRLEEEEGLKTAEQGDSHFASTVSSVAEGNETTGDAEKSKAEMMEQLKKLGDMCLSPFGLSTDSFEMTPQAGGGYNIQMKKK